MNVVTLCTGCHNWVHKEGYKQIEEYHPELYTELREAVCKEE